MTSTLVISRGFWAFNQRDHMREVMPELFQMARW